MIRHTVLSVTCAVLLGAGALALASGVQADEIAQRKVAMQNNGKAAKELAGMFKGEMAFDGKAVAAAGYTIANDFAAVRTLFPKGSTSMESRAKPEIWSDMAGFEAALNKADDAAKAVAAAGEANDEAAFKAAFGTLGKACGGCHEKFRAPKKG
jgi:cytochrome c556